jgi:hypothetical protein
MAITEYYVSAAGGGAHDGTSEANALTLTEMFTQINALGAGGGAGRRYNIKGAHTARGAADTLSVGGTATSPLILRGYNGTIGDLDTGTRDAYGALDTANYPDVAYSSTFRLVLSATHVVLANIDIAPDFNGAGVNSTAADTVIQNCRIVNSNTGASTSGITTTSGTAIMVNCDISHGASGGIAAVSVAGTYMHGCRITSAAAIGIRCTNGTSVIEHCTIRDCGTNGIETTGNAAAVQAYNNTIYGCVNGVDIISTSTARHIFVGNHVTDNSGIGFDFNAGASGGYAIMLGNRTRDNTSGATSGYDDWVGGTSFRAITTDSGAASTDYVDAATNKDFRLISTAAGYRQGFAYNANIGANGDNVTAGAGGLFSGNLRGNTQ